MSNDTGSWSLQPHRRWAALCIVCQWVGIGYLFAMPAAVVLIPILSLPQTHLYRNMKSRLELASGTLMLFSLFALVSTQLQAEKHLSSKSPQTTTVLNLIKDITDNRRAIKQQSFQRSARAYIPLAQRVTALSFTSQRFFKVISPLCVPPPPPLPVNQLMLVVWNNSFNGCVICYLTLNKECSSWLQLNVLVKYEIWGYCVAATPLDRPPLLCCDDQCILVYAVQVQCVGFRGHNLQVYHVPCWTSRRRMA